MSGLANAGPCMERVRIFSEAFAEIIDSLPTYRPFLLAVQKEYDAMIQRLTSDYHAVAPLEGRLKTMRAESLSFVGESMTWFQMEIDRLRRDLRQAEAGQGQWQADREQLRAEVARAKETAEKDKVAAMESHHQNLDILKHLERCEKQVEKLKKQEKELHTQIKELGQKLDVRESRIQTMVRDLNDEREKLSNMVPKQDLEAAKDELRKFEIKCAEWQEMYTAKEKDYLKIVETYSKKIGQPNPRKQDLRPLTPRPTWVHCHGLLEPDAPHSVGKAELAQQLLQQVVTAARTLLSAYGLEVAAQKSSVFQKYATHKLAAPLHACGGPETWEDHHKAPDDFARRGSKALRGDGSLKSKDTAVERWDGADDDGAQEGTTLEPDVSEDTPQPLRHLDKIKNLSFSRKRVADFLDELMLKRARMGPNYQGPAFLQYMLSHIRETIPSEEDALTFAVNIYAAVRRYSAEPDFLAYLLLLLGKIPDAIVRDNKQLCSELLRIFVTIFDPEYGNKSMTKQKFFYHLREVLQNKDQKKWQALVPSIPAGGPEVFLNYERLLLDDLYVLSPVVYSLRLQHLEEILDMAEHLATLVQGTLGPSDKLLKYGPVEAALREDQIFEMLTIEDYAKAFGVQPDELRGDTEQDVATFMELMKTGEVFHIMFYPAEPREDADISEVGDIG